MLNKNGDKRLHLGSPLLILITPGLVLLVIVMLEYRVFRNLIKLLLTFSFISFANSFACETVSYADFKYILLYS